MVKDLQLKADLLALGREIDQLISIPKKPRVCKYCGIDLPSRLGVGEGYFYCSQWCIEMKNQGKNKLFTTPCKVEGCKGIHSALGYCGKHYKRFKEHGDPLYVRPIKTKEGKQIKQCSIEGCDSKHKGLGYCKKHYEKFKNHGDANWTKPIDPVKLCKIDGCSNKHQGLGYCNKHYYLFKEHGDALYVEPVKKCTVEGCTDKHHGKGYCKKHYSQLWFKNKKNKIK